MRGGTFLAWVWRHFVDGGLQQMPLFTNKGMNGALKRTGKSVISTDLQMIHGNNLKELGRIVERSWWKASGDM